DWVAAECGEEHRRRAKVLWKWLYRDAHWAESTDDMAGEVDDVSGEVDDVSGAGDDVADQADDVIAIAADT
ncbi:unnamed protein product, partial [Closterium sp. NIES-53]